MATKTPAQAPQQAITPPSNPWMRFARSQPLPVQIGTLIAGRVGGTAADFVTLNPNNIPEVPAFCNYIDLNITVPIDITIPAAAGVKMSPYAPYSGFSVQMVLAGSPEWPSNVSLVPFWLDELINAQGFDPFMSGPNLRTPNQLPLTDAPDWFYGGIAPASFALGADTILPGQTVTNATTVAVHKNVKIRFQARIRLQRRWSQLWGMIPLGDPQNRPALRLQLNALIGTQLENAMFVATAGSPTAVVDTGGVYAEIVFRAMSLDILPPDIQLNQPLVSLGLNVTYDNSFSITNAGQIQYQYQRTAMIYEAIHQLFINGVSPMNVDYLGLWLNQNQQSARWAYDANAGSMQDYYADNLRKYERGLPSGHFVFDLANGEFPAIPRETPYNGLMSPDAGYAAQAGVPATPNMSTAWRVPAGTDLVSAYTPIYAFGLVRVPY